MAPTAFRTAPSMASPATCGGRQVPDGEGLEIDEFSRGKMDATLKELMEERDGVKHLLG